MSDVDAWDADDFEPELPSRQGADKWAGEDEDDEVKDNWEDEEEENATKKEESDSQVYQRPKKKPLSERIAEKEAKMKQEQEEQIAKEKEEKRELTPEEKLAEKIRLKKIQEQDSLNLAKGLFGVQEGSLDKMFPATEEEFGQFAEALKSKITFFEESKHYSAFVSKFINDLALGLGIEEVKKLGISINSLYHEKDRQKKEADKKKKKKSKAVIKVDRADDLDLIGDATGGGGYYDDDDFI